MKSKKSSKIIKTCSGFYPYSSKEPQKSCASVSFRRRRFGVGKIETFTSRSYIQVNGPTL
jgi:hypothetical protein